MSIDPLKVNAFVQRAAQSSIAQQPLSNQQTFEQLLTAVTCDGEHADKAVAQVDAALKLAQLQLLQGLLVTDETDRNSDLFTSLRLSIAAPPQTGARQQVDKAYRAVQPTLSGPASFERAEIDRLIDQVAAQVSLAPELIRSVVTAESNFQPDAISPVGAQGLMQLMPATAQDLGVEDSFDPQQNLLGGSRYLKQLLDKYDGDLDKALAAYNWGQGNVDRRGLAQMPQETSEYLTKVKGLLAARA